MELALILPLFVLMFALGGLFSGLETGLISIDRLRLENEAKRNAKARRIVNLISRPDVIFGLTLTGTNVSQVVLSTLFTVYLLPAIIGETDTNTQQLYTLALAGLILIFGEILPKTLFREFPYTLVSRTFPFIRVMTVILKPFIGIFNMYNNWLARVLQVESGYNILTRDELTYILSQSKSETKIQQHQKEMLEDALEFRDLRAKNVMIPRTEIVAVEAGSSLDDVLSLAKEEGYTRFPVYDDNLDQIIGILIIYDLLQRDTSQAQTVREFIREVHYVPETMDVYALLREMQTHRKTMVIVVDSYGGTAGLLTVEDILEEIVGEIEDEYDTEEEKEIEKINENTYLIQGFVEVDDLNDEYDIQLPGNGNYETLAGLIIDKLERIPTRGQKLRVGDWDLEMMQVTRRKIQRVKCTRVIR
ncbi:MAG: hemolysin family protein [Candidatus Cloacimonetes bacterium]|nr:hemolysin family protein [Candidatus Cloacimonadota bacterium]